MPRPAACSMECLGRTITACMARISIWIWVLIASAIDRVGLCLTRPKNSKWIVRLGRLKQAFNWFRCQAAQTEIEPEECTAVGAENFIVTTHFQIDVRMVSWWRLTDTFELTAADANL